MNNSENFTCFRVVKTHFGRRREVCARALSLRKRNSAEQRQRRHNPSDVRERRPPGTTPNFICVSGELLKC